MAKHDTPATATGCLKCGTEMSDAGGRLSCPSCGWGVCFGAD